MVWKSPERPPPQYTCEIRAGEWADLWGYCAWPRNGDQEIEKRARERQTKGKDESSRLQQGQTQNSKDK